MKNSITQEDIDQVIEGVQFYVFPETTFTVCLLTLTNGYKVSGESACIDPSLFDEELGRQLAFDNAKQKIWTLEGYLLKQAIYEQETQMEVSEVPNATYHW